MNSPEFDMGYNKNLYFYIYVCNLPSFDGKYMSNSQNKAVTEKGNIFGRFG